MTTDRVAFNGGVGAFVTDMLFPNCCFIRGMKAYVLNYWNTKLCDNTAEAMKCALGRVSECCPGKR